MLAQKEEKDIEIEAKYQKIKDGLYFLVRHSGTDCKPWPRKVLTPMTRYEQRIATDALHAMSFFQGAFGVDCYINLFGLEQRNPNCILLDLDNADIEKGLASTLRIIDQKLGGTPSVYHTGRGYHILQPIKCPAPLETIPELMELDTEPSNKFLQFAKRYLSNGKADDKHNPALKSSLTRIPNSTNSKNGNRVTIIQEWDGYMPYYRQLYDVFYDELKRKKQKEERRIERYKKNNNNHSYHTIGTAVLIPQCYLYVEKLLKTPLEDDRKLAVGIILSRYLINVKKLECEQAYEIIWQWLDKCANLRRLEPSRSYFDRYVVRYQLELAQENGIPAMTEHTLRTD